MRGARGWLAVLVDHLDDPRGDGHGSEHAACLPPVRWGLDEGVGCQGELDEEEHPEHRDREAARVFFLVQLEGLKEEGSGVGEAADEDDAAHIRRDDQFEVGATQGSQESDGQDEPDRDQDDVESGLDDVLGVHVVPLFGLMPTCFDTRRYHENGVLSRIRGE